MSWFGIYKHMPIFEARKKGVYGIVIPIGSGVCIRCMHMKCS